MRSLERIVPLLLRRSSVCLCVWGMDVQTRRDIPRTVEDRARLLLMSANMKSYMPHGLAQQRMTLSDIEWPFHPHRALSLR